MMKIVSYLKRYYLCFLTLISPKLNSKVFYKQRMGKSLNLKNPIDFNEKIQWLKLNTYYNNPLITKCADKLMVRDYIKELGHEKLLNDIIAVYDNVDEIKWDELPNKFVIKWNYGCGYNLICSNKAELNIPTVKKKLKKWGKKKFHLHTSEMQYKNIEKKLICEKYLENKTNSAIEDYKFYCFNGNPYCVMICIDRDKGKPKFLFFDKDWKFLKINKQSLSKPDNFTVPKPKGMDEMFKYAASLSKSFPFVRVDFYNVEGQTIFGELTFTPSAGMDNGYTDDALILLGNMITLN